MNEQFLSCPNCKNQILFNVNALLLGASFECIECKIKIKLAKESKDVVGKSMDELNKLKKKSLKK